MLRSNRIWWIAGIGLVVVIFALLAAIAGRGDLGNQGGDLTPGESEILRALVVDVLEEGTLDQVDFSQPYQHLLLRITTGPLSDHEIVVEHGSLVFTNQDRLFQEGDRVLVEHSRTLDGEDVFYLTDYVRTRPLLWLTLLFAAATLLLSGWQGVRSLIGMGVSLAVIISFIVPQILDGRNPLFIAILGSVVMMGISLYLVYGWKAKTHVAVFGLFASLIVTGLLAVWFVNWTRLSGFGAEEASFLQVAGVRLDTQGLLLAGIIVGTLGALDDIAIGQSSAIFELSKANPSLDWRALFKHGMTIGRDHIAAMVNTLLLAYVGAALPLVLLFSVFTESLGITINRAIIAEEIVRTLVGSLGLLAGVPLTSLFAALVVQREARRSGAQASEV
ncbi:MAG TPA: YibE/F family protein [Anaerolineae bacterium]|nr:YibE/F family protein [Anaerolineae bacterium]